MNSSALWGVQLTRENVLLIPCRLVTTNGPELSVAFGIHSLQAVTRPSGRWHKMRTFLGRSVLHHVCNI